MKRKIVVIIGLNTAPFNEKRFDEDWLRYRIDIFMRFTRKSLENQTYKDFLAVVAYEPKSEDIVNKILDQYVKLPKNIIFTNNAMRTMKNFIKDTEDLIYVRLDSDDMYHPTYFERLINYNYKPDTQAIICQDGYAYDIENKRLTTYHYQSPPFYAYIYKVKDFINGLHYKTDKGHVGVISLKHEIISGNNFCVILHGKNTGTNFYIASKLGNEIIDKKHMKLVLDEFNIEE